MKKSRTHVVTVPVKITKVEDKKVDLIAALVTRAEEHTVAHLNGADDGQPTPKNIWTAKLNLELAQLFLDVDSKRK